MTEYKQMHARTKKRKQFIIEYEDGSKEIIKEGLLFGLRGFDFENERITMVMKACGIRTDEKANEYFHMLMQFLLQVSENEERFKKFIESFNG